ncbi:MAG: hypothetical protein NVSMB18_28680 [Acetobacteraceae bacterium]
MTNAIESLEQHEHAEHLAHGAAHGAPNGAPGDHPRAASMQWSALLVACLAAALALAEQGAKHAEIRVQQASIDATDAWAQYQAKSTRGSMAKELAAVVTALSPGADPAAAAARDKALALLKADQDRFENDPKDGKDAVSRRAHAFEHVREHSLEQTHAYHNGSAAMQLGIVLATASAIIRSKMLLRMAFGFGLVGAILAALGYLAPQYGAL